MLLYLILGAFIVFAHKLYNFLKCPKELENIPAVPFLTFLKFNLDSRCFREKMKFYFQPYFNEFGVIRVFTNSGWALFVGDPKLAKEISIKSDIFHKPSVENVKFKPSHHFMKFLGSSHVQSTNGEEWRKHRKIINPVFNQTWSTELFGSCARDLIDEWEKLEGSEVKIHDKIQRMTLDVFGKAIFDIEFKSVKNNSSKIYNLFSEITEQMFGNPIYIFFGFLEYLPFTRRPKLAKQLDEYHGFILQMIELKKQEFKEGKLDKKGDLVSAFIESNENGQEYKLKLEEIRDNVNLFILAGHDTTSNTLTSTLYYLARYPEIQDKLRAQVLAAMDNPNQVEIPTINQLKKIPLMDMVNKESMRIMTTISSVKRRAICTHTLSNSLVIPKNTDVSLELWGIHHNPSAFRDPFEFKPERFDDISNEESKNWQSFVLGNRTCIGSTFSLMEQRVTLAMLLQKFEFSISTDNLDYQQLRISGSGLARPKDLGIDIKLRI